MNPTEPFEISSSNGRLEIRCAEASYRLSSIDAGNLASALDRTIKANLEPGQRLPLTTSEIELLNFSEFVTVVFALPEPSPTGNKQIHIQLNKQQIPAIVTNLRSHLEILKR